MTKEQTVDLLRSQLPGFYSAEQVINLIEKIEISPRVTPEIIQEIKTEIIDELRRHDDNGRLVDEDDINLDICNREIEISNINIDFDLIKETILEALQNAFPVED